MFQAFSKRAFAGLDAGFLKQKFGIENDLLLRDQAQDVAIDEDLRAFVRDLKRQYQATVKETEQDPPQCARCMRDLERRAGKEEQQSVSASFTDQVSFDTYRYDVLPDRSSFRLLELEPATVINAPLRASLKIHWNRNSIKYIALSYTWAGVGSEGILDLVDGRMQITGNLDLALRALRRPDSIVRIWVDAVCINQHDKAEKAIQVAEMATTYRCAKSVLGWLGPESEHTTEALNYLLELAALSRNSDYDKHARILPLPVLDMTSFPLRPRDAATIEAMRPTKHLDDIYDRAWFTRFWIVQEIHLAKRITLQIGAERLDWKDFRRATLMLYAASCHFMSTTIRPNNLDPFTRALLLVMNRDQRQHFNEGTIGLEDNTPQIYGMTESFNQWQCKDERDRIYALLSLVPDDSDMALNPDYDAEPEEVFTKFARQLIRYEGLSILTSAGLSRRYEASRSALVAKEMHPYNQAVPDTIEKPEMSDLPSWVPDPRPWKGWSGRQSWRPQNFRTATLLWQPEVLMWRECPHRIALKGAIFDSVQQTIPLRKAIQKQRLSQEDVTRQLIGFDETLYYMASVWFRSEYLFKEKRIYPTGERHQAVMKSIFTASGTLYQLSSLAQRSAKGADWIDRTWSLTQQTIINPSYDHIENAVSTGEINRYDIPLFLSSVSLLLEEHICLFTKNGLMGFAPKCIMDSDVFAWIDGYSHPVTLRPMCEVGTYQLVGPCYIHGVMDGELGSMNIPDAMHSLLHLV